jgi:hypothetical protein
MKKSIDHIKLNKSGVFLVTTAGKNQIAAPIRFKAIGHRPADDTDIAEVRFMTREKEWKNEYFEMSDTLPRDRHKIIAKLAKRGYRWPTTRGFPDRIVEAMIAEEPSQRFTMVGAPGWYDDTILTSYRQYGKGRRFVLDPDSGARVARITFGQGSLEDWQNTVAKTAKKSSRLRLMIGAAFAALLLRPLNMDSFALNLFGTSSTGKTSGGLSPGQTGARSRSSAPQPASDPRSQNVGLPSNKCDVAVSYPHSILEKRLECCADQLNPPPITVILSFLSRREAKVVEPIRYTIEKIFGEGKRVHYLADRCIWRITTKRLQ